MNNLKRYVLTEDNIIISKNDKRIKKLTYSIDKTKTYIYLECDSKTPEAIFDCEKLYYATGNLVVKQSDNVFDLIEIGDLVECYNSYIIRVKEKEKSYDGHIIFMNDYSTIFDNHILRIYKPNEKGDYIKVWEVKDNE